MEKKLDKLGRIVVPSEYRRKAGVDMETYVNVEIAGESLVITPAKNPNFAYLEKAISEYDLSIDELNKLQNNAVIRIAELSGNVEYCKKN